jgi:hypothetical protein
MHHQPEPTVIVYLHFDEVIPTAERAELKRPFAPAD